MGYTIAEAIAEQSTGINVNDWHCLTCRNHKGGVGCSKNVFIAFTGANMSRCIYYEQGRKCEHCGRVK